MNRIMLTLAGLIAVAACDPSTGPEPDPELTGTFRLSTVDGEPVPLVEWSGISGFQSIEGGEIVLLSGAKFRLLTTRKFVQRSPQSERLTTDTIEGTFRRQGDQVVLTRKDGTTDSLGFTGATLNRSAPTVNRPSGVPWVYQR